MTDRRSFLRKGAAGFAALSVAGSVQAAPRSPPGYTFAMPRGMTLLNMLRDDGYGLGVRMPDGVIDVTAAGRALGLPFPVDMDDLLQLGKGELLGALVEAAGKSGGGTPFLIPETDVSYAPLVTRPEKIIMMGFNYKRHAEETGTPIPKNPPLFNKYNNALNHHGGSIILPTAAAKQFDYEVELVIVFGKECHDVSEDDALDYVAGYATGNDFSARDLQTLTSQFMIGKTCDGFAPLGPYLVTADLVKDPNALRLETRVNGTRRQDSNTNDMIFNCRQLISFASRVMTIKPGDVFFTGTPEGVIFGEKGPREQRQWLKAGDEVACSLEGLGELKFKLM